MLQSDRTSNIFLLFNQIEEFMLGTLQIKSHIISVILIGIMILITVAKIPNNIDAELNRFGNDTTLDAHTLDKIVHRTNIMETSAQITVGHSPSSVIVYDRSSKVYVANSGSDTVSVIDGANNVKLKDITVGQNPGYMSFYPPNKIYVVNSASGTVSLIDLITNTKIKDAIPVGENPGYIAADEPKQKIYVDNYYGTSVSVINGTDNTKIKDITVGEFPNATAIGPSGLTIYVANSVSNTVSVINTDNDTVIKTITNVGLNNPSYIFYDSATNTIYVANSGSNTVSVINGTDNTKIKDITVGRRPDYIGSYYVSYHQWSGGSNTIYVANSGSNTVSVINGTDNTKIKDITVGKHPDYLSFGIFSNTIYVANSGSNTVSVINGTDNTKIKDITVGENPSYIAASKTNTIYTANPSSDSISAIDGVTNKVVAGVKFNISPSNSGQITCNNIDSPINQYLYVPSGENCIAKPNKGFEFGSWTENLGHNSTRTVTTSSVSGSPLNFFLYSFGIKPNDTSAALDVTQFGNFSANFKALPPPIPPGTWIPLYGVIVSTMVGWSVPSIIGWINSKRQRRRVRQYLKRINSLYDDNKLDENDIESLDTLTRDITDAYMKGRINEQHYGNLKNKVSKMFEVIYKNKIHSINTKLDNSNLTELDKIKDDYADAYASGKITEQHYNLLNEEISDKKITRNSS